MHERIIFFVAHQILLICSGNPKDEPGAILCRVAQSFLRFGSYQIHASRGKDDLGIVGNLADYTIKHHFPHIENMNRSETLSFNIGEEENSVVDLTSNKYAGDCSKLREFLVAWSFCGINLFCRLAFSNVIWNGLEM